MLTAVTTLHAACALVYAALAALIAGQARRSRTGLLLGLACLGTAGWAATVAACPSPIWGSLLDPMRMLLWFGFAAHLYRRALVRPGTAGAAAVPGRNWLALAAIGLALGGTLAMGLPLLQLWRHAWFAWVPVVDVDGVAVLAGVQVPALVTAARLGLAVCNLLLVENLYRNTPAEGRWHVNLLCIALGGMFVYDVILAADTALFHRVSPTLFEGRALAVTLVAPLLALAAARNRDWAIDIHVSRAAAFHSATLVASGVLLMSLAAAGELVRHFGAGRMGADWSGVVEVGLIFAGLVAVAVLVTSGRARSRLRTLVVDHFFSHRYDYRREWSRCIATLSAAGAGEGAVGLALHTRVIRAVAEIVDAPGGVLFLRDPGETAFQWAGSWNMPAVASPVMPDHPLVAGFRDGDWIVPLNRLAATPGDGAGEAIDGLQLAVPLGHDGGLIGFILAARPRAAFRLDGEVFDLLRIVGREVARTIAEQRLARSMVQTRELHEYAKRFAFVAHDIKNVSNQLSLLLANAEVHLENPEFQRDMLATVRASVQKINVMIRRLQDPGGGEAGGTYTRGVVTPAARLPALAAAARGGRGVGFETDGRRDDAAMPPANFDAVVTHLVNNAVEASAPDAPVAIRLRHEARRIVVDVVDRGCGMSPEFVRDALFQPFRSSKGEGTGIGAYQARELLREAGGDLVVISQPGEGTTMRLMLPALGVGLAAAAA
jgi:putative PEP-CTERM system histidine kinase